LRFFGKPAKIPYEIFGISEYFEVCAILRNLAMFAGFSGLFSEFAEFNFEVCEKLLFRKYENPAELRNLFRKSETMKVRKSRNHEHE
jgi:hypothetical protein